MTNYLRAYLERSATSAADPGTPIRFVASTEGVGRDGMVIAADGWQLDNYRANPTVLWSHDYTGNRPPIGKATNLEVQGKQLLADVVFDQGDEFARSIERKYRDGFLNAVSVGWDTQEMEPPKGTGAARVTRAELLDISAVNIPGDPGALIQRQMRALREALAVPDESLDDAGARFTDALLTKTDTPLTRVIAEPETPASVTWDETAASMVRLLVSTTQRPDAERESAYRKLARDYARHGKTPPELLDAEVIAALGDRELRGLFLNGEPDLFPDTFALTQTRAGAVLSKRNLDDLQRAADLITGVITRASKEAETAEPDPPTDDGARAALEAVHRALAGVTTK